MQHNHSRAITGNAIDKVSNKEQNMNRTRTEEKYNRTEIEINLIQKKTYISKLLDSDDVSLSDVEYILNIITDRCSFTSSHWRI